MVSTPPLMPLFIRDYFLHSLFTVHKLVVYHKGVKHIFVRKILDDSRILPESFQFGVNATPA